jgi:hypothetical protein
MRNLKMGERIGYEIRGNHDRKDLSPGIMLYSNEHINDAEEIFKSVCRESIGPTNFMQKLSLVNVTKEEGKDDWIFWVTACLEDTEKVISVAWDQMRERGDMAIFSEKVSE